MPKSLKASIIIPSLARSSELSECLKSLEEQTVKPYEIIIETKEGPLAKIRNEGARKSRGDILIFTDDDVIYDRNWLHSILEGFGREERVGGVSGPSFIRKENRKNRDIFRWRFISQVYNSLFLDGKERIPGHISKAGAWTTGACYEDCDYEGEVEFLEACNMAFKREAFEKVGGFDEAYKGIGDWSEPDLSFRVRQIGYRLWFSRNAKLEHRPSKSGAFKKRSSDSRNRMANYELFASRWVKPCWRHSLYKLFMRTYYEIKAFE